MNTFDDFVLTGANATRYVPILGDATKIVGAYRKRVEALGIGQVPLFLIDGELNEKNLCRAIEKLKITIYVAVYRSFDVKIKKMLEELEEKMHSWGYIQKDGTVADWIIEVKRRLEEKGDGWDGIKTIIEYIDFEKAKEDYAAVCAFLPVDAATGGAIIGDMNKYLYERAKAIFPIGVESILEVNAKQSAIPKGKFFMDGLLDDPAPKNVRKYSETGRQITLFDIDSASVDDSITELQDFFRKRIEQAGAVTIPEVLYHCAEIGLYNCNITLYAIGAAFRIFDKENAIFFDGVSCWRFSEVRDISSWILRVYELIQPRLIKGELKILERKGLKSAIYFDDTTLKDRLRGIFGVTPPDGRPEHDTLGMAIIQIGQWVIENLRYPIAFLDEQLHRLYREHDIYGDNLRQYDSYFTQARCEWIRTQIPCADNIARREIEAAVGFDPDKKEHPMSNLPKGHYMPILWSAEDYIGEIRKEQPPWMKGCSYVVSASEK